MNQVHKDLLEKILKSQEFSGSAKYQKLLKYLVESSLAGNIPKEVTIAYEVFGLDINSEAVADSNIRVYIHNIRKKLDSYYINEGQHDNLKIVIPKGRYKVEFVKVKEKKKSIARKRFLIAAVLLILVVAANIVFLKFFDKNSYDPPGKYCNYVWKDIVDSEKPLLVVIGDYYLVNENTFQDRVRYVRDSRINSEADLDSFLIEHPEVRENFFLSKHTLLGKFAPMSLKSLSKMFYSIGKDFKVILSSDFQWHDIQDNNLVYIGSFKSLGILDELIQKSSFNFTTYPNELQFYHVSTDSLYQYYSFDSSADNSYESDYAVVTKFPGSGDSQMLFFLSSRDIGLISTVNLLTDLETLTDFEKEHCLKGNLPDYFEASFMTQGLHRNIVKIDLLHINYFESPSPFDLPLH